MYKITVINTKYNRNYSAKFESLSELEAWRDEQVDKNSWGLPDRVLVNPEGEQDIDFLISDNTEFDLEGNPIRYVHMASEYNIVIEEITESDNTDEGRALRLQNAQKQIELYKKMTEFGSFVKLYFTSLINSRPITQEQKDLIQTDVNILAIQEELNFGRIGKAKSMIALIDADEDLYYQEDLDKVILIMDDFLTDL